MSDYCTKRILIFANLRHLECFQAIPSNCGSPFGYVMVCNRFAYCTSASKRLRFFSSKEVEAKTIFLAVRNAKISDYLKFIYF